MTPVLLRVTLEIISNSRIPIAIIMIIVFIVCPRIILIITRHYSLFILHDSLVNRIIVFIDRLLHMIHNLIIMFDIVNSFYYHSSY